jgi:uncharacterized damage-inducible protein DinB
MITRIWHGKTRTSDKDNYLKYLTKTGVRDYLKTKGNLGVQIRMNEEEDFINFWIETKWDSIESIKSFSGDDINIARYYEEDKNYLIEPEPTVKHFETIEYYTKSKITGYINQYEKIYDGASWVDENFIKKLHDVTAENSIEKPIKNLHSIMELVAHIVSWRKIFIERLKGNFNAKIGMNSPEDWIPSEKLNADNWGNIFYELEQTQMDLIEQLRLKDDSILDTSVGDSGYDFQFLIEGMIQHDVYHLGQIGIVKKLINMKNEK